MLTQNQLDDIKNSKNNVFTFTSPQELTRDQQYSVANQVLIATGRPTQVHQDFSDGRWTITVEVSRH